MQGLDPLQGAGVRGLRVLIPMNWRSAGGKILIVSGIALHSISSVM